MSTHNQLTKFLEQCDISIDDEIISNELIMETYSKYLSGIYNIEEKKTGLALHTGSKCFDAVAIVLFALFCLVYDNSTPEDVISSLNVGDKVIYGKSRAIYLGKNKNGYVQIEQETTDHGYKSILKTTLPPLKFYKIKPYYGESKTLDGRGIRIGSKAKAHFLETVFEKNKTEICGVISNAVIVVCDRELADLVIRGVGIHYGSSKTITLPELLTASYFTENSEYQYPGNPGKSEPALRFANTVSLARYYVLSDEERQIVGVLFCGKHKIDAGISELPDFINRRRLKNVLLTYPIMFYDSELLNTYPEMDVFACTEEMLLSYSLSSKNPGVLTQKLNKQISNILDRQVNLTEAGSIILPGTYRKIKSDIALIKETAESDDRLSKFVIQSYSLLNFLTNIALPIDEIEQAIESGELNMISPITRLAQLGEITESYSGMLGERLASVYINIDDMLKKLSYTNPKKNALLNSVAQIPNKHSVLILVPKQVHKDIITLLLAQNDLKYKATEIETVGRFDYESFYDVIITTGVYNGKRFSMFSELSAPRIECIAYSHEFPLYSYFENSFRKQEALLNKYVQKSYNIDVAEIEDVPAEHTNKIDYELEKYIEYVTVKIALQSVTLASAGSGVKADVVRIATTTEGETIFFTKYYTPYVFNEQQKTVDESDVKSLLPGDVLLFTKNSDQAKDIVDEIIARLADSNNAINEAFRKSKHWKQKFFEYKEKYDLSFQDLSHKMTEYGTPKHEVTLRTWLNEESHIVGPREQDAFHQIALICDDEEMLANPESFHEASNTIRSLRIKILKLIGQGVIRSFQDVPDENDILMDIIKDELSELSQIVQIEAISNVSDIQISASCVNRPYSL
mgnify:CR=1 FL=1